MKNAFPRLLPSVLLALALLRPAAAPAISPTSPVSTDSATTPNGVVATDFSLGGGSRHFGGALLRVQLSNPTPFPQEVRLAYPDPVSSYSDISSISTTALVPPASTTMAELPLPIGNISGRLSLTDSSGKPVSLACENATFRGWSSDSAVYATPSVRFHAIQDRLKSSTSHSPISTVLTTQGASPWPEDFRAYCRYAACMLSAEEFAALPSSLRTSLFDYAAAGGILCLFGTDVVPKHPFANPGRTTTPPLLPPDSPSPRPNPMPQRGEMKIDRLGFGALILFSAPTAESLSDPALQVLTGWLEYAESRLGKTDAPPAYAAEWKAIDAPSVHIAGVFLVLVVFSILAGPVLVVVLARRNRRIHILWLLPALSAAFSLLLLAVFLLTNGIRPILLRDANVLLDQGSGRAVVAGHTSILAPLSLRKGLVFDRGAILRPDRQDSSSRRNIDVGASQVASASWVAPGIVTGFTTQSVAPTHQRVEFARDETGAITARNLLGAPIASLEYRDENGRYYTLSNLDFGATARLSPGDEKPAQPAVGVPKIVVNVPHHGPAGVPPPLASPKDFFLKKTGLSRPYYIAEIDADCPFLPDPLPDGRPHRIDHAIVFGLLESVP